MHVNSRDLFLAGNRSVETVGPNGESGRAENWALVQDRPGKYGWVIKSSGGDEEGDTIRFNIELSEHPMVLMEYMHTYENIGIVSVSIEQEELRQQGGAVAVELVGKAGVVERGGFDLTRNGSLVIDAYEPEMRHSMSTDFEIIPVGFAKGPAVLRVRLLRLRADELAMRGGRNRFKIVSVSSC